ncbi:cell division protein FtsX [Defluviimonas sp. WL0002]|uniref:Cell division protein FtsX n=1 Tax=Albidovulum marisflavi TaxID=2984159 RepID=A0ABT2Z7M4_9RHOB|nr:cell division protein FtsX [Defluviimonas sp. WL0002]MCV2867144.1 cell division protein FtsX [Defluviimonas sp. WL0002]
MKQFLVQLAQRPVLSLWIDRIVPPAGQSAQLTLMTAAAMAFLAVFALALAFSANRLADSWSAAFLDTATVRVSAAPEQAETQVKRVLEVLATTPGVTQARAIPAEETQALLAPWFGPDLPVASLPIPRLIEVSTTRDGFDAEGLALRLQAEAPGAKLDDHLRWRRPLVETAIGLRRLAIVSLALIGGATAAMVTLAAQAALAANGQVIRVLHLIGARDVTIARAFVRRFTLRTLAGALAGTALAALAVAFLPVVADGEVLAHLGFSGREWLWPLCVPAVAAVTALLATRAAALSRLKSEA